MSGRRNVCSNVIDVSGQLTGTQLAQRVTTAVDKAIHDLTSDLGTLSVIESVTITPIDKVLLITVVGRD